MVGLPFKEINYLTESRKTFDVAVFCIYLLFTICLCLYFLHMCAEKSVAKWPSPRMGARWPSIQSRRNRWWRCTAGRRRERGREAKEQMTATPQMLSCPLTPERWESSGISFPKLSPKLSLCPFFLSCLCLSVSFCALWSRHQNRKLLHFSWHLGWSFTK